MHGTLPNDVLLLVGEQLQHHADRWNLIFVSRHFNHLFLPSIYRLVQLGNWHAVRSFFLSIANRPFLASAVRELDLSGWQPGFTSDAERDQLRSCSLIEQQVKRSSHSGDEKERWENDLSNGSGDAWVALILPMLSSLRQLHLNYSTHVPHLERIMQRAIFCERPPCSEPAFQYLREVSLHYRHDFDLLHARDNTPIAPNSPGSAILLSFFRLPSVRKVIANSVVDPSSTEAERETPETPAAGYSSMTEIDFRASSGNQGMEMLIATCANLKSFKYQLSDANVLSRGYQPAAFRRSLARSKETLHTLWLDHYGEHYAFTVAGLNQSRDEWFGSLADFTALRELRIRLPNLLDIQYRTEPSTDLIECLPPSLETLFIEGCEDRHMVVLASQLRIVVKKTSLSHASSSAGGY